jgi:hypothetical protein
MKTLHLHSRPTTTLNRLDFDASVRRCVIFNHEKEGLIIWLLTALNYFSLSLTAFDIILNFEFEFCGESCKTQEFLRAN